MKAVAYRTPGPLDRKDAFVDVELPTPEPRSRDLLVEVQAVSVNPVDYQVRSSTGPDEGEEWKVVGWDAAGVVRAIGSEVTLFQPGDEVYYAGSIDRSGSYAQHHLVDERIVGRKPSTVDWAAAAALPLTSITAWEALFHRMDIHRLVPGAASAIVIVGGAGGVGSVAIQLARQLTDLTVIATASRAESVAWATDMGAHHVINHARPLAPQVAALGIGAPAFVFSTTHTDQHAGDLAELIAPQGRIGLIDHLSDVDAFFDKSVSIHLELMFTRPLFNTTDMSEQHNLLNEIARLVDEGTLRSTEYQRFAPIDAVNVKRAHFLLESGATIGKLVLHGFGGPTTSI